jgi:hypothetical protein
VVSPQVPTRRAVGQAVFDHDPHRQIDDPVGIMTARWRQIREVGAKVLATLRTVMLGIRDDQITWTPQVEIAQVVQRPMRLLVLIGRVSTARTRMPVVVATVWDNLGRRQIGGRRDPFARVGSVLTWTEHRVALLAQWLGPELYDKRLLRATRSSRYSLHFCTEKGLIDCMCRILVQQVITARCVPLPAAATSTITASRHPLTPDLTAGMDTHEVSRGLTVRPFFFGVSKISIY